MKFAVFLFCIALQSCSFGAPLEQAKEYKGATNEKMKAFFLSQPSGALVSLTSHGGREKTALEIANIVMQKNISINVKGYCVSSCSQYILMGSPRVVIEKDAFVSFHHNSYGIIGLRLSTDADLNANSLNASRLYKQQGVREEFLGISTLAVGPFCIDRDNPRIFRSKSSRWVPSREDLEVAGIDWKGYWPSSKAEAVRNVKKLIKSDPKVVFSDNFDPTFNSQRAPCLD